MPDKTDIRTKLALYATLERGETVSQLALAKRLSVSVGLINALLKRAVRRGVAKARAVPARRWAYCLTPRGFAEKSRLVALYLEQSLAFFREARAEYADLFVSIVRSGRREVILAGCDELAEVAILAARDSDVEVVGILDPGTNERRLYGFPVLRDPEQVGPGVIFVITDRRAPQEVFDRLAGRFTGKRVVAPPCLCIVEAKPGEKAQ